MWMVMRIIDDAIGKLAERNAEELDEEALVEKTKAELARSDKKFREQLHKEYLEKKPVGPFGGLDDIELYEEIDI